MKLGRLFLCTVLCLLLGSFCLAQQYSVRNLGTIGNIGGVRYAASEAINDMHQVVGSSTNSTTDDAFLWSKAGGMQDLGNLGIDSNAVAINSTGTAIAGCAHVTNGELAFLWTQAGGMQDLGTLGGGNSCATGVNSSGQVVGWSNVAGSHFHAFSWTQAGGMQDLGTLGGADSFATGINDNGYIVGYSQTRRFNEVNRGFLRSPSGIMKMLPALPGGRASYGLAVNKFGDVSGMAPVKVEGRFVGHAILWTRRTGIQDIGALTSGVNIICYGSGINSQQEIVGYCVTPDNAQSAAFVWTQANGMQDLNTLIPAGYRMTLVSAGGVNKYGQIAVTGLLKAAKNPSEATRALLLDLK